MKLLVLPSWYPPNGGDFFVNQTKWLNEEGVNTVVVSVEDRGIKQFKLMDLGNYFKPCFKEFRGIPSLRKIQYRIPFVIRPNIKRWIHITLKLCEKYIQDFGEPDLIQVHSCMWAGVVAARIKKKYKIPYIITEHRGRFNQQSSPFPDSRLPWYKPLLKEALENTSLIIPVSANMIPVLEAYAEKKIPAICIPNPVNESLFHSNPGIKNKSEETRLISISAFTHWKALEILIEAFYRVAQSYSNIHLHLVGNGPEYAKIHRMVNDFGLKEKIHFYGMLPSDQVHKELVKSDFLVLSSRTEGQPVVIGEAILSGIPVITTDVVSKDDVPEFAGYIIKKEDPEALAESIITAHLEKDKFNSEIIREFGIERFSKAEVVKQILEAMYNTQSKSK